MSKSQTTYIVRELDEKRCSISKWEDGEYKQVYVTENSECQCPGAMYHRTQCRHMLIRAAWLRLNKPHGQFIVKNGKVIFLPLEETS